MLRFRCFVGLLLGSSLLSPAFAEDFLPRRQTKPPGPPLTPEQAVAKMTVPAGFKVELVAAEPDVMNPVAMAIDERGRFWITESFEYPRHSPGPGKDRIKILTDTDGDGRVDQTTIFAEGLNIPSGIAVGYGGVWVANAPDLLFLQDTDGDGKADKQEVVVTGFGREDTHELPNSLTWGPDGWLYGLNGVFNNCHVKYPAGSPHFEPDHPGFKFSCALFRIHPKTREFQIFCEGTSNPWGLAIDHDGSFFISACVIDHLWHLTETGYYIRQGGPYPATTWKMPSIVKHKHQMAAYCGINYFDSDAYPEKYRDKLYMGNIHGNCLNSDRVERVNSTYKGLPEPDFLTANDAWFMPVVQKTGPDGSLYVLDWYDRYHCYQDANRDPAGIDRGLGRLYRIRYGETPRAKAFDLSKESDSELIERLKSPNVYFRDTAQRILTERANPRTTEWIEAVVFDVTLPKKVRMHALFVLIGAKQTSTVFLNKLFDSDDETLMAWGVRAAGEMRKVDPSIQVRLQAFAEEQCGSRIHLQLAIAARKIEGVDPMPILLNILTRSYGDVHLQQIVWQNLRPMLPERAAELAPLSRRLRASSTITKMVIERMLAQSGPFDADPITRYLDDVLGEPDLFEELKQQCLESLAQKLDSRELSPQAVASLREKFNPLLMKRIANFVDVKTKLLGYRVSLGLGSKSGLSEIRKLLDDEKSPEPQRASVVDALFAAKDPAAFEYVRRVVSGERKASPEHLASVVALLDRSDAPETGDVLIAALPLLSEANRAKAVETLTQRPSWSKALARAVKDKKLPVTALNANQIARLSASKDVELIALVREIWGTTRTERNPRRELVIDRMRNVIRSGPPGDPLAGEAVFTRVCAQCHKLHGAGQDVGPDITLNGRNSFEQLLSNVFDPSLTIGVAYQPRTVETTDGKIITGLLVEDNEQRVALKTQGGKVETIPRAEVESMQTLKTSLMPEEVEKQFTEKELRDLFALLTLDKSPRDPAAKRLAGVDEPELRKTDDPKRFAELVGTVAPGFRLAASGVDGVQLHQEFAGRKNVLQTHPVEKGKPAVLTGEFDLPADSPSFLRFAVTHHPQGDWELIVRADGRELVRRTIGAKAGKPDWETIDVDLSAWQGKPIKLELENRPSGWAYEFGYWHDVSIGPKN